MPNTLPPSNSIKPVPNNLTVVRFGPYEIDFTLPAANYIIGQLEYDEQVFIPTSAFIEYTNVIGTFATAAVAIIDNGFDSENITASTTLAATVLTPNNSTANLSAQTLALASPYYVTGGLPVATTDGTGAASTQSLRVKVTTSAIPTLTSISHYTANNISTINVTSVPASYTPGSVIRIKSSTTTTYNGVFTITATTGTTISFYNPNVTTEGTSGSPTADSTGKIGACTGSVYVVGILQ